MISWITKSGVIYEGNEKTTLPNDLYIRFYADGEFNFSIISTNIPSSVVIGSYFKESENIYAFKISGSIPSVLMDTTYSICCRLKQDNKIVDSVYSIDVKNVQVTWDESIPVPPETIKIPVNTYNIYKLKLVNANGDEIIKKIDGALPEGIFIGNDGSIFGNITDESLIGNIYNIVVTVFINDIAIARLNKELAIEVIGADPYDKPTWVTEAGYIGAVYVNKRSTLRVVATNSTTSQALFYKLEQESNLPDGIELENNGKLTGMPTTQRTQSWEFTVTAFKIVGSDEVDSDPRTFTLITNPIIDDDEIIWDDDADIVDLGNCVVGQTFYGRIKAHTKSGLKITYKIIGNTAPVGVELSSDGIFSGIPAYQKDGEYLFTVQAKTSINTSMKTVRLTLKKGLGAYAANVSFAIWIPQIDVYNDLIGHLSKSNLYKQDNPNFEPKNDPLITVCTIRSYDRELLPLLLNFAYPEWIRFHKTTYKNVVTIDRYDDIVLDNYDVIYKTFDEAHYQWEDLKNGSYDWEKNKPEGDSLTWNNMEYNANKIELPADDAHPHPINKFKVMNIPNIRECLTRKVYLDKLHGTNWYFSTDQQIANSYIEYSQSVVGKVYVATDEQLTSRTHLDFNTPCDNADSLMIYENGLFVSQSEYTIDENHLGVTFNNILPLEIQMNAIYTDPFSEGNIVRGLRTIDTPATSISLDDECEDKTNLLIYQNGKLLMQDDFMLSDDKREVVFNEELPQGTVIDYVLYQIPSEDFVQYNIKTYNSTKSIKLNVPCRDKKMMSVFVNGVLLSSEKYSLKNNGTTISFEDAITPRTFVSACYYTGYARDVSEIIVDRDGQEEVAIRIEEPYIYKASLNPELETVSDFILPHIRDIVEEEDGKYYCQLLDLDNEILPYWKRKDPVVWTTNTFYKINTVILYEEKYYLAMRDFTSTFNFNDNLDSVWKLTSSEVDNYLTPVYFPCLELGYYQAGKNVSEIAEINALENNGEFWTGQELVFDEVVVQPYYQNKFDTQTVTIVYPNIKNFPDGGVLEKE